MEAQKCHIADSDADAPLPSAMGLPPELVAEIFLQCPNLSEMRQVFCQICSAWRHIAISTPRLWTDISLDIRDDRFDNQMSLLRTWCDRAGALSLSVTLKRRRILSLGQNPVLTLIPYMSRIRAIDFTLPRACFQTICSLPDGSLRSLERFTFLCRVAMSNPRSEPATITVFESAPRLHHVSILQVVIKPLVLRLPSQLTSFDLNCYLTPAAVLRVLQTCPNLECARVVIGRPSPTDIFPTDTVLLPRLRKLDLQMEPGYSGDTFFIRVILPVLDHFGVYHNGSTLWPHSSFLTLISRSPSCLKTLDLRRIEISAIRLIECLGALPSLLQLRVECVAFGCTPLLHALRYTDGADKNLVPRLQELNFGADDNLSVFDESFATMLESRWWSNPSSSGVKHRLPSYCRLLTAHVAARGWKKSLDVLVAQRLNQLQQEGLIVTILGDGLPISI